MVRDIEFLPSIVTADGRSYDNLGRELTPINTLRLVLKNKRSLIALARASHHAFVEASASAQGIVDNSDWDLLVSNQQREEDNQNKLEIVSLLYKTNLAGFYALIEGIGVLFESEKQNEALSIFLQQILDNSLPDDQKIILTALAHLSWRKDKAWMLQEASHDQAHLLFITDEEGREKAWKQIQAAADQVAKLLKITNIKTDNTQFSSQNQLEIDISLEHQDFIIALDKALRDETFLAQAAIVASVVYVVEVEETKFPEDVIGFQELSTKGVEEIRQESENRAKKDYAQNVGSILALATALELKTIENQDPVEFLTKLLTDKLETADIEWFCRFVHLTWIKDQSHKNTETSHRSIGFFDDLSPAKKRQDLAQILGAAMVLVKKLGINIEGQKSFTELLKSYSFQ